MASAKERYLQIDIMKALAIFTVVAIHGSYDPTPLGRLFNFALVFIHPVPLFFIIMGFNYANSFKKQNLHTLKDIYTKKYFLGRIERFVLPLVLLDFILLAVDGVTFLSTGTSLYGIELSSGNPWTDTTWTRSYGFFAPIGALLYPGAGTYFITMILTFIFVFPLLYRVFQVDPRLGLLTGFGIELAFQLIAPYISIFKTFPYLFDANILRYFSAITLGLWFSGNHGLLAKRNAFVWVGAPISIALLILNFNSGFALFYGGEYGWWGSQNLFTAFHVALVFLFLMRILPSQVRQESRLAQTIARPFAAVSDRTYHILLIQTAFFFLVFAHAAIADSILQSQTNVLLWLMSKILLTIVEFSICALLAFGLYWLNTALLRRIKKRKDTGKKEGTKDSSENSESTSTARPKLHETGISEAG